MAPSDNFFYTCAIFLIFVRICPVPYEEVLEDIIKTVWTEQCGNLKELRYLGEAALVSLPRVKFSLLALHFLLGRTEGKNGSFIAGL